MLLCDIGNTTYHFFDEKKSHKEDAKLFNPLLVKERVFYICVNAEVKERIKGLENWVDLSLYVDRKKYYETMGIDRIMACEAIKDGIVVDAGSAITVDRVRDGVFEGGFIYAGVRAMQSCYKNISAALEYSFNFELDLDKMPKNSRDAISYGYLKPFCAEVLSYGMQIYLTGGDAKLFERFFADAVVDDTLLFRGMKNIMKKANLC